MGKAMLDPKRDLKGATPDLQKEEVEVPHPSYQPTAQELREDLRLKGTFEGGIKALLRPVRVRKVMPKRPER